MSKVKVALAMIVKASDSSEAINLARCLGSVNSYVDGIFIQLNARKGKKISPEVRAVAEQFADFVYEYEWQDNFVNARNDSFSKVPKDYDWIVWADADDVIDNPEMIQPSLAIMPDDVHGVHIIYDYLKDEFGNVVVSHWNTRAVRNDNSYAWKSSFDDDEVAVHETLNPRRGVRAVANDDWKVVHMATGEHFTESLLRNITLLEGMAKRQALKPEGIDPRILFYLATHYVDAYRFDEALELLIEYLKLSGWAEERAEAHTHIGKILVNRKKYAQARNAFLQAIGEYPDNPGPYLELSKLEAKDQRWEQSASWAKRGLDIKPKLTAMVQFNHDYDLLTHYAQALSNLGGKNLSEALKMAQKAYKLRPFDPAAKDNRDTIQKLVDYRNNLRGVARVLRLLSSDKEEAKIIPFLDALPDSLQDSPVVIDTRHQFLKPVKWAKKTMAIYVGSGPLGNWSPKNLNAGGLGGSEEAVIRLSNELVKLGWDITVFGTPGREAGDHNGVHWRHYWEINNKDQYDVLISWRQPQFFDFDWKARKKYLWLHDVMEAEELIPERIKNVTKIIYVSKYHSDRPENAHIKPGKKLPSGNGITPADFSKYDNKFDRDPRRCIYMSANERGLRILLDIWPDVLAAVPGASLTPYYGWHSFDAVNRDNPERMAWKATMIARMKELGIPESVRLGQDDINKEIFKSGILAYPTFFPEVNNISTQKAMAGGAWPVTSDFAVLPDIVKRGDMVPMGKFEAEDIERYKVALIHRLKNPPTEKERQEMMEWARETFAWSKTAAQWSAEMS